MGDAKKGSKYPREGWGVGSLENMSKIKEQERGKENKIRQK